MMTDINEQMVGTRNPLAFPLVTIAGRPYTRPASTCNLGNGKFCVLDNSLSTQERDERLKALRAMVAPRPSRKRKSDSDSEDEE